MIGEYAPCILSRPTMYIMGLLRMRYHSPGADGNEELWLQAKSVGWQMSQPCKMYEDTVEMKMINFGKCDGNISSYPGCFH